MALPRFAPVAGGYRSGSSLTSWPDAQAPAPDGDGGVWFAWRLLGGNNREMGRSAATFSDLDQCRWSAMAARAGVDALVPAVSVDVRRAMWRWRLDSPAGPVAVAARLYLRQRECQYNLAQFLTGIAAASMWGDPDDDAEPDPSPAPEAAAELAHPTVVIDLREPRAHGPVDAAPARVLGPLAYSAPLQIALSSRARQDSELARRRYVPRLKPSPARARFQ